MNAVVRAGRALFAGVLLAGSLLPVRGVSQTLTNLTVRVMAANTTSGNYQCYESPGIRIFQGLKPDIVAIQEFRYNSSAAEAQLRQLVDLAFGPEFNYYREPYTASGNIPNGIVSRYPIVAAGSWLDTVQSSPNRGFAWARIRLPGTNDLYVVSVHLLSSSSSNRAQEAANLKALIQANFPQNAWIIVAGDFNTGSRTEAAVTTFKTFLSDNPIPTDAVSGGDADTNERRNNPYDYILPSFSLASFLTSVVLPSRTFPNGLVFDSAVYTPLSDVSPVLAGDSHVPNMQHMGVVKDFRITWALTNSGSPIITAQPRSQGVNVGSNATFTVAASGAAPLAYQWRCNQADIPGAATNSYTRFNAQLADSGSYSVVVTNSLGSITSSVAVLTVGYQPAITAQPQDLTTNLGANVSFAVAATGTPAPAYQWRFNSANLAGATGSSFPVPNVQSTNAGSYSVVVTNAIGSITSSPALLTVLTPPVITAQPQPLALSAGQNAVFNVSAVGAAPLSYQWRFNGAAIFRATDSSYTRSAQAEDAGSYSVVITNYLGSVTSADAVLTVSTLPAGIVAQWNFNSPTPDASPTSGTLVPSTGNGTAAYVGGTAAPGTGEFGTGSEFTDPAGSDNSAWVTSAYPASNVGNKTAGVRFDVSTAGKQNIRIRWDQKESNTGSKYTRLQYSTNGTFYDVPTAVTGSATSFVTATNDLSALAGVNNNPSFAFRIVAEFESTATGSGSANYIAANSGSTYGTGGTIRFDMVTVLGTPIPPPAPPSITAQPQNQTVAQGAAAAFAVSATSSSPMTWQWQFNSADLPGATSSSYLLTNAQPANMGIYSVMISNAAGSTSSSNAVLSLIIPQPLLVLPSPGLLQWQGLSNLVYTVQAKTNLSDPNWTSIGSISSATSDFFFIAPPDGEQQFYRVVYP